MRELRCWSGLIFRRSRNVLYIPSLPGPLLKWYWPRKSTPSPIPSKPSKSGWRLDLNSDLSEGCFIFESPKALCYVRLVVKGGLGVITMSRVYSRVNTIIFQKSTQVQIQLNAYINRHDLPYIYSSLSIISRSTQALRSAAEGSTKSWKPEALWYWWGK